MGVMKRRLENCSLAHHPHAFISKLNEPIVIEPLHEKHNEQLVQMYLAFEPKASFSGLPPADAAACRAWVDNMISRGGNLVALAFDRGVVGHAGLFPVDADTCEMLIVVAPSYQNVSIGTELVRCSIQVSHELAFKHLWACVETRNLRIQHVLRKCGFDLLRSDDDEIEMRLNLAEYHHPTSVTVGEVMNRNVISVFPDWSCRSALAIFLDNPVDALPVIDEQSRVVGILSQTDLIIRANIEKKVGDVLTRRVITVSEDSPLTRVLRLFRSRKVRCVPVVDADAKLVGIITRKDVLRYYAK